MRRDSNKIDIVNFLKNNPLIKLYKLLLLDFKKFIKLKKRFTGKTPQYDMASAAERIVIPMVSLYSGFVCKIHQKSKL